MHGKKLKIFIVIFTLVVSLTVVHLATKNQVPSDNYITIDLCGVACTKSLLLDLNINQLSVYTSHSYNLINRVSHRYLDVEEVELIRSIFESKEYLDIPEENGKFGLDGELVNIHSKIRGKEKFVGHWMSESKIVRRIIDIHYELIDSSPNKLNQ